MSPSRPGYERSARCASVAVSTPRQPDGCSFGARFDDGSEVTVRVCEQGALVSLRRGDESQAVFIGGHVVMDIGDALPSRPFVPTEAQAFHCPLLASCYRAGMTEDQVIEMQFRHMQAMQKQLMRYAELASPMRIVKAGEPQPKGPAR